MRVSGIAAIDAVLGGKHDTKGKSAAATTVPLDASRNYGSVTQTYRSGSGSGERLERVLEDEDDGEPPEWVMGGIEIDVREGQADDGQEEDEREWSGGSYRHAVRLYMIVPLCSFLLFVLLSFTPILIWPGSLPHTASGNRLALAVLLAASLWSLSHALRVPTHKALALLFSCSSSNLVPIITTFTHSTLLVILQEFLRLASFAIFSIHWHQLVPFPGPPSRNTHTFVRDTVFREVWFLGLGWALAEVCAGIMQGYEQLSLYEDEYVIHDGSGGQMNGSRTGVEYPFDEDSEEGLMLGSKLSAGKERLRRTLPCVEQEGDDDMTGSLRTKMDLEVAIAHLTNVKERDDLEEVYGMPFMDIPVFVSLLQRIDSMLLSLGLTLTLAFAYLSSYHSSEPLGSPSAMPIHGLHLLPTFIVLVTIHAFLGILHTPPVLSRIGIHAAAYIACLVGLGLVFAGIGVWVGLW